ncbi:DoxX family membrane protein [Nonomuraea jiangxiensis]|uniref:DoxX protein n=1 Tax=Nonomuraea jiangxiensis TaxID=633440 RepID=A0A1G7ZT44_9ACTN|nr:DoxX family membrane protein [Nonomuraea jiangxiensis]SDH11841.1 DoxX protein [Nonomuraea jiangxiensis]
MKLPIKARTLPGRLATGAYILHSGLEKWRDDDEQHAAGIHGTAANAFPFLKSMSPRRFMRLLAAGEIATGAALLAPFVPAAVAGAALTGFSASLVTMYLRTPALHKPGSVWPTPAGIGISKDVWMLGIGIGLIADAATDK